MIDPEIIQMQREWLETHQRFKRWIITEEPDGFWVHCHTEDGVAPPTRYPTKRLAASRILQLLGVGPVAPQDHPEEVCIGHIKTEQ